MFHFIKVSVYPFSWWLPLFLKFCLYIYKISHVWRCPWIPEEDIRSIGTEVAGGCDPSSVGAGNGTLVFCESRAHSKLVGPKIVLIFEFRHTVNSTDGLAPWCLYERHIWTMQGTSLTASQSDPGMVWTLTISSPCASSTCVCPPLSRPALASLTTVILETRDLLFHLTSLEEGTYLFLLLRKQKKNIFLGEYFLVCFNRSLMSLDVSSVFWDVPYLSLGTCVCLTF